MSNSSRIITKVFNTRLLDFDVICKWIIISQSLKKLVKEILRLSPKLLQATNALYPFLQRFSNIIFPKICRCRILTISVQSVSKFRLKSLLIQLRFDSKSAKFSKADWIGNNPNLQSDRFSANYQLNPSPLGLIGFTLPITECWYGYIRKGLSKLSLVAINNRNRTGES